MRKPYFSVVQNKTPTAGRINIYGVIGPGYWDEGNEAKSFVRELSALESKFERIDIHINSPGGSIWDGLPIFNAIRASTKEIHTYVDGIALSMGAIIALAGHTVHAAKGSMLMLHNAGGGLSGDSKKLRAYADMLDKHDDVLAGLIADKTGKTVEEVKAEWLNYEDHFFTPTEALEAKLIDVIEDYAATDIPDDAQNMTTSQLVAFYNEIAEEPSDHLVSKIFNQIKNKINPTMKFPNVISLAGVENATSDQLAQANADLATAGITNCTIVQDSIITDASAVTAERDSLTEQLTTATTAQTTAEESLATANNKITNLESQIAVLNKKPGATHNAPAGKDEDLDITEESDFEKIANSMAHNQKADNLFG